MISQIKKAFNCLDRLGQKIEKFETKYESQINLLKIAATGIAVITMIMASSYTTVCGMC